MELRVARITSDRDSVVLTALGDIQYGTDDCDVERLRREVQKAVEAGSYFVGMGDYVDLLSPSNRYRYRQAGLHDSAETQIDDLGREKVDELAEILEPTRGRWLGLLQGHHYMVFGDGETTDTLLAAHLGAPFLGDCALIVLELRKVPVKIYAHHGAGFGQNVGAPLLRLQQAVLSVDADLYLMAHQHKLAAGKPARFYYDRGKVVAKELVLACTGSFMQGYRLGRTGASGRPEGSYVEKRMLPPVALGCAMFEIGVRDSIPEIRVMF